jgi:charged multivesicular body protein 4
MLNMQSMRDKLEETATATHTFEAMQGGATDLTRLNKNMKADKIADVMDQVQEANDMANEALDALAQPIGGAMVDDDDLLAELDELDQADLDEQMMGLASPAGKAPATTAAKPGAKVAPVSAQDEDDLEELERMMNA